jgi:hypothetical protein
MKNNQRNAYVLRDCILSLLSEEEVASVCTAETAERLLDGDEYLDLEQLDQGVRRAQRMPTPMARVLPRKAVHQDTWSKILMQLTRPAFTRAQPPAGSQESQSTSPMRMASSQPLTQTCVAVEPHTSPTFSRGEKDLAKSQGNLCLSADTSSKMQPE